MDIIDVAWARWADLDLPYWNPYGASFVLLVAIWLLGTGLRTLDRYALRPHLRRREPLPDE